MKKASRARSRASAAKLSSKSIPPSRIDRKTRRAKASPRLGRLGVREEPSDPLRIVALGGGTGLSTLLKGLKRFTAEEVSPVNSFGPSLDLAAIVTVSDDGGSSGRLRKDFDILAPGDIRNCLVALAEDEALLSQLFQYRFLNGRGLQGHSFGNLFLTALTHVTGDFHQAIQLSSEVLAIRGRIYPSTLTNVRLEARLQGGRSVRGESRISSSSNPIKKILLNPRHCRPLPETLAAISEADLITLGPGSLYTSIIPNLLVDGIAEAIASSPALKVYIANLMWQPGETVGYTASDHLLAIHEHAGRHLVDCVIANSHKVPARLRKLYGLRDAQPVEIDQKELKAMGVQLLTMDLLAPGPKVRHNADHLANLLAGLAREARVRKMVARRRRRGTVP